MSGHAETHGTADTTGGAHTEGEAWSVMRGSSQVSGQNEGWAVSRMWAHTVGQERELGDDGHEERAVWAELRRGGERGTGLIAHEWAGLHRRVLDRTCPRGERGAFVAD